MKKKLFKAISMLLTVAMLGPSVNLTALATEAGTEGVATHTEFTEDEKEVTETKDYSIANPRISDGVATWDCVYFGEYWQDDTNGDGKADNNDMKIPIKWRVLSIDGDNAFLMADQALDCKAFHEGKSAIYLSWSGCTLRTWLNGDFYNRAFNSEEQNAILATNLSYGVTDKIYLLKKDEASNTSYGFSDTFDNNDNARKCKATAYAVANNASTDDKGNTQWWLRSMIEVGKSGSR